MSDLVKDRLPKFTREQSKMVKGSFNFIGVNYYLNFYAADAPISNTSSSSKFVTDAHVVLARERNGIPIGPKTAVDGFNVYPRGIRDILLHMKKKYKTQAVIYITENGMSEPNNSSLSLEEALVDTTRIDYLYQHLSFLREAIQDGVDVRGYFAWALVDSFEWASGYTVRFGLNYVDFRNGLKRYPKSSAFWFKKFLQK